MANINANPQTLNGKHFSNGQIEGLDIHNAHIRGLEFYDIQADHSRFTSVTFENCSFTLVNFQSCRFENVAFKNCRIQGKGDHKDINNSTIFRYSVFKNVLFENTKIDNVVADSISGEGGYVYFRDMHDILPRSGEEALIIAYDIQCRVVDSNLTKADIIIGRKDSFYSRNSKFFNTSIQSGRTYIEKCSLKDMAIYSTDTIVITNSVLDAVNTYLEKTCYYVHNQYIDSRGIDNEVFKQEIGNDISGYDNTEVYVVHKDSVPALLGFGGGRITASDITLKTPIVGQFGEPKYPFSLNLRNVRILGGYWTSLDLESGNWENVEIEPPLRVEDAKLNKIQAYNLEYPKGDPWKKEGEFSLDITRVFKPFDWPEVRVPTPADMSMEWWPSEPGYHPEK